MIQKAHQAKSPEPIFTIRVRFDDGNFEKDAIKVSALPHLRLFFFFPPPPQHPLKQEVTYSEDLRQYTLFILAKPGPAKGQDVSGSRYKFRHHRRV